MEKGYRYFGTDMTMLETPFEAGLGAFVRLAKGDFVGRAALEAAGESSRDSDARRLRTLRIGGADWLPVYGGEAVRANGAVIGRLRSVAFGPTVSATIGYVYVPAIARGGHRAGGRRVRRADRGRDRRGRPRRPTGERMRG